MSENPDTEYTIRGPQSFGMALHEFRMRRGMTQAELANNSGLHRSYLSDLERGASTVAMRNFLMACRELDLEIVIRAKESTSRGS